MPIRWLWRSRASASRSRATSTQAIPRTRLRLRRRTRHSGRGWLQRSPSRRSARCSSTTTWRCSMQLAISALPGCARCVARIRPVGRRTPAITPPSIASPIYWRDGRLSGSATPATAATLGLATARAARSAAWAAPRAGASTAGPAAAGPAAATRLTLARRALPPLGGRRRRHGGQSHGVDRGARYLMADVVLDVGERYGELLAAEADGVAFGAGARRAADAVNVVLGIIRQIEIN